MSTLRPIDNGLSFDLAAVAAELQADEAYSRKGQTARTLVHSSDLRVVVIALKAGKTIAEHHADATASVQTLSGHVSLQLPDHRVALPAGRLLLLGAGLNHNVHAEQDSVFMLTLGWTKK